MAKSSKQIIFIKKINKNVYFSVLKEIYIISLLPHLDAFVTINSMVYVYCSLKISVLFLGLFFYYYSMLL